MILFFYFISCIKVVEKGTVILIERLGKFHRKAEPGLLCLIPFVDRPRSIWWRYAETSVDYSGNQMVKFYQSRIIRIDLREVVMDFPNQAIVTRDNVEIVVHPMLLYKIHDPIRVAYEVYDLPHAVEKLVQTTLRSIIGDMGLDDTLASREEINRAIRNKISNVCLNWGFEITQFELLEIHPTPTIQSAMHKQLAAERIRRANIVTADGYREQVKTRAEGDQQSMISLATGEKNVKVLDAKGQSDARVLIANAEAEAVRIIAEALKDFNVPPTQYLIGLRYIDTFCELSCKASKRLIYFPFETDIIGAMSRC